MGLRRLLLVLILLGAFAMQNCPAQPHRMGIAYYDLDHFYDTIPSLFYDDTDFTPRGKMRWTAERYERRVRQTAALLDSMQMPIVGLWSVESEAVVRDLAAACQSDYSYIHRTLNSLDGMDFALLYYGDRFFPHRIEPGRRYLYIEGVLRRPAAFDTRGPMRPHVIQPDRIDTVGIVLCSDTRMAAWVVGDLRDERPWVRLLVLGRSLSMDAAAYGLQDPLAHVAARGRGNIRSRGGWQMRDRILTDTAFRTTGGDVFARRYLVDQKTGNPLPTYDRKHYRGGYGYALPVFVYLL